jgi:hypothetical protein
MMTVLPPETRVTATTCRLASKQVTFARSDRGVISYISSIVGIVSLIPFR